jgi:hypothetical protein
VPQKIEKYASSAHPVCASSYKINSKRRIAVFARLPKQHVGPDSKHAAGPKARDLAV